jgi:hypothetical protein
LLAGAAFQLFRGHLPPPNQEGRPAKFATKLGRPIPWTALYFSHG